MREILFRGKKVENGAWIEGGFFQAPNDDIPFIVIFKNGLPMFSDVAPETVGQFTGLTDKNGKRIFEGDILRDIDGGIQTAIFDRGAFCGRYVGYTFNDDEFYANEVIGNIHDNPELLEGR